MPRPPTLIDKAFDLISKLTVTEFNVEPGTIQPFAESNVTVKWRVTVAKGAEAVRITLNEIPVSSVGSLDIAVSDTTTFSLSAEVYGIKAVLSTATVSADTALCRQSTLPQLIMQAELNRVASSQPGVRLRSPASLSTDSAGLHASIRATASAPVVGDIDVNIDFSISLFLDPVEHLAIADYSAWNLDLDIPWWAHFLDFLTLGFFYSYRKGQQAGKELDAKSLILDAVQHGIFTFESDVITKNLHIYRLWVDEEGIQFLSCPFSTHHSVANTPDE